MISRIRKMSTTIIAGIMLVGVSFSVVPSSAFASVAITSIELKNDGGVIAHFDTSISSCSGTVALFDSSTTYGKNWLNFLLAAFLAGRNVSVTCTTGSSNMKWLNFF